MRMVVAWGVSAALGFAWYRRAGVGVISAKKLGKDYFLFAGEAYFGSLCFLYGLGHSELVVGTTLSSLAPIISAPAAVIMGLERWSWRRMGGVFGVVAGIVLLLGG
jgi:drug/metabolite transporter (DMT)-like permease